MDVFKTLLLDTPAPSGGGGGGAVDSVSGTANEITSSPTTGAVSLSLPAALTFTGKTVTGGTFSSPTLTTPALGTPTALVGTNITGTAAGLTSGNVTTNANLTGDVTSVGNATTLTNAPVIAKVLTGYTSGAGTVSATDSILQAIQKLNGNDATNANLTGAITSVGNATSLGSFSSANLAAALTDETGSGANVFATSPTLVTPNLGTPSAAVLTSATGLPLTTGVTGTLDFANGGTNSTTVSQALARLTPIATTVTSATTVTLTNTSATYQIFTGSTAQTIILPVTSTLETGWQFSLCNNSTAPLTIQTSAGTALFTGPVGCTTMCKCIATGSTAVTDWEANITEFSTNSGTGAVVLSGNPTLTSFSCTGSCTMGGAATSTHTLGSALTTGTLAVGGTATTGTITLGQSTASNTINIDAGATASGNTKTLNVGTGGLAGSTTTISIGSTTGTSTTTLNGINNGAFNGTLGATTPSTVAATTISATGLVTATVGIRGVAGTTSAATGNIGEAAKANLASSSPVTLTNNTAADVVTLSLTAGDWDVSGFIVFVFGSGTTSTDITAFINTTANTKPGINTGQECGNFSTLTNATQCISTPVVQIKIGSTTTVRLGAYSLFSIAGMSAYGTIYARRSGNAQ